MKKKHLAIVLALFSLVLVMGAVFFYVAHLYNAKGLSLVRSFDKVYHYNGKLLLSQEEEALLVKTLGATDFETLPLEKVDLSPFGFEGESLSYYKVVVEEDYGIKKTFLYTPDENYEGLWPVLKTDRLVYQDKEGKKYCIHPLQNLCYPMFSDSMEGVDPYGTDVLGFSGNGSYALSLEGDVVKIYHTDPMDDSLRVVDVKEVSLSEFGTDIRFGAFLNNTDAYFTVKGEKGDFLVAVNCKTGQKAKTLLDLEGKYGTIIGRLYAQRLDKQKKNGLTATWSHLLLGEERTSPKLKGFEEIELFAISPEGTYAVGKAKGEGGEEILCMSKKRAFSLSSVLEEETKVLKVDFIFENLLYVTVENGKGNAESFCYKICFS